MAHANGLPEEKADYLRELVLGRPHTAQIWDAALLFYHAEVPLQEAKGYMNVVEPKLKGALWPNK